MYEPQFRIYLPGTPVKLVMGNLGWEYGRVQAVRIQHGAAIDYQVIYWIDGDRYSCWVESFEIESLNTSDARSEFGFVKKMDTRDAGDVMEYSLPARPAGVRRGRSPVHASEKRVVFINHYRSGLDTFYSSQEKADDAAIPYRLGCTVHEYERPVFDGE